MLLERKNERQSRQARKKPLSEHLQFNVKNLLFLFIFSLHAVFRFFFLLFFSSIDVSFDGLFSISFFPASTVVAAAYAREIKYSLVVCEKFFLLPFLPSKKEEAYNSCVAMLKFNKGHSSVNTIYTLLSLSLYCFRWSRTYTLIRISLWFLIKLNRNGTDENGCWTGPTARSKRDLLICKSQNITIYTHIKMCVCVWMLSPSMRMRMFVQFFCRILKIFPFDAIAWSYDGKNPEHL